MVSPRILGHMYLWKSGNKKLTVSMVSITCGNLQATKNALIECTMQIYVASVLVLHTSPFDFEQA